MACGPFAVFLLLLKDERDKCGQAKNQAFYLFAKEDSRPPERGAHPLPNNNNILACIQCVICI